MAALAARECTGWMAYSEGVFDDVNKALLAGLSANSHANADEALAAYAERYLNAVDSNTQEWGAWLKQWGRPYTVDSEKAFTQLANLRTRSSMFMVIPPVGLQDRTDACKRNHHGYRRMDARTPHSGGLILEHSGEAPAGSLRPRSATPRVRPALQSHALVQIVGGPSGPTDSLYGEER